MESIIQAELLATIIWAFALPIGCIVLFMAASLIGVFGWEEFSGAAAGYFIGLILAGVWAFIAIWNFTIHLGALIWAITEAATS